MSQFTVYDHASDQLVTYDDDQVWSRSFNGDWIPTPLVGDRPRARFSPARVHDPAHNRIIMFGGWDGNRLLTDTWQLSLDRPPQWTLIRTAGASPASHHPGAIYDPVRNRMVLYGGYASNFLVQDSIWVLSLGDDPEWTSLEASGSWVPRAGHATIYEARRDRLIAFGGGTDQPGIGWISRNDVWSLELSGTPEWHQLHPGTSMSGEVPLGRISASLTSDPSRDRMILVGGTMGGIHTPGSFGEVWQFDLEKLRWQPVPPQDEAPPVWDFPTAVYDSRRDRLVFVESDWLWALERRGRPTADAETVPVRIDSGTLGEQAEAFSLAVTGPNPFWDSFVVDAALPEAVPARLDLFDVLGRRVWAREIERGWTGRQRIRADGLAQQPPGVYLLRLTQQHRSQTIRLVHARPE